jgi:hypothetical protein
MEYLEGASLEAIVRSTTQQPTLLQKIDIIVQACHGLGYAHQQGIVHRDIKPGNIMVLKDGCVKIVDFGIARIGDTNFTRTGQFMGSLNYMSLEQLNEKLQVDQRTDVYSTGVVLYQFLTGILPFEAESTGATLMKIFNDTPPPFSKFLTQFPPELEAITLKALAKDRDQRYSSAEEFALELTELADRLKQEAINVHMQQAEILLQKNDLVAAHNQLIEVLKIDKQHMRAATLLRSVRKTIEKEQSTERARQFRDQAEEAFRREEFDPALGLLDQAISLDSTNADLQKFRGSVQSAKAEAEQVRQALLRAENAHRAGNLDTAKQVLEEVLLRRPNDTKVKSLYRTIEKDLEERQKQKRLENLMEAARNEINNRRYTAAFDILKEAEKVDPEAPQLRALLEKFNAARDQEQRRKGLEQVTRQVEQAINSDDNQVALNLAAEGLKKYPNDPTLLKLRDLAETQKQTAEQKAFVKEKIAGAREILNAGNAVGALKVLEDALQKAPGNPHLESLLSIAQERLTQERDEKAQAQYLQQANAALGRKAYAEAIQLLEAGQLRFASSTEIDNLLRFAREQQSKAAQQQEIDSTVRKAQEFLRAQDYDKGIELLESIVARVPDEELRVVLDEAKRRRDDLNRQTQAAMAKGEQFLAEGNPAKAVEFLQAQPAAYKKSGNFRDLLQKAVSLSQAQVPEPPRPVVPVSEMDAPPPSATMVWDPAAIAPPPVEPLPPRPIPTVTSQKPKTVPPQKSQPPASTTKGTQPQAKPAPRVQPAPVKPVSVAPPGQQQKLILFGAIATAVLCTIVVVWWMWPSSGGKKPNQPTTVIQPAPVNNPPVTEHPPEPPPTPELTAVAIHANLDTADVYVDDVLKGSTDSQKSLELHLTQGSHTIRVEKQGYAPSSQTIDVSGTTATEVKFELAASTAAPNAQPKDSYLIISGPSGAAVKVDQSSRGLIPADGTLPVKVSPDTPHRIEIAHEGYKTWTATKSAKAGERLAVNSPMTTLPRPTISSFAASSEAIQSGQSVKISWQTSNATDVTIQGIGANLQASGSQQLSLSQTTTFVLIAKNDGGTETKQLTVNVSTTPAPTITFTANPATIQQGQSTTLSWQSQNATQVTIPGLGAEQSSGSFQVTPDKTATFTIEAKGPGGMVTNMATVTVLPKGAPTLKGPELSDIAAIRSALDQLQDAYASVSIDEMVKAWPSLNKDKKRKKGLDDLFKRVQALRVKYSDCTTPSLSGDTAKISCTQSMTSTISGKVQPPQVNPVKIVLKKNSGTWLVNEVSGQ